MALIHGFLDSVRAFMTLHNFSITIAYQCLMFPFLIKKSVGCIDLFFGRISQEEGLRVVSAQCGQNAHRVQRWVALK